MVPNPTIKIRKRERGLTVYTKVIDMFRNLKGINLACYWAFDAKKRRNYAPKANKSDQ